MSKSRTTTPDAGRKLRRSIDIVAGGVGIGFGVLTAIGVVAIQVVNERGSMFWIEVVVLLAQAGAMCLGVFGTGALVVGRLLTRPIVEHVHERAVRDGLRALRVARSRPPGADTAELVRILDAEVRTARARRAAVWMARIVAVPALLVALVAWLNADALRAYNQPIPLGWTSAGVVAGLVLVAAVVAHWIHRVRSGDESGLRAALVKAGVPRSDVDRVSFDWTRATLDVRTAPVAPLAVKVITVADGDMRSVIGSSRRVEISGGIVGAIEHDGASPAASWFVGAVADAARDVVAAGGTVRGGVVTVALPWSTPSIADAVAQACEAAAEFVRAVEARAAMSPPDRVADAARHADAPDVAERLAQDVADGLNSRDQNAVAEAWIAQNRGPVRTYPLELDLHPSRVCELALRIASDPHESARVRGVALGRTPLGQTGEGPGSRAVAAALTDAARRGDAWVLAEAARAWDTHVRDPQLARELAAELDAALRAGRIPPVVCASTRCRIAGAPLDGAAIAMLGAANPAPDSVDAVALRALDHAAVPEPVSDAVRTALDRLAQRSEGALSLSFDAPETGGLSVAVEAGALSAVAASQPVALAAAPRGLVVPPPLA